MPVGNCTWSVTNTGHHAIVSVLQTLGPCTKIKINKVSKWYAHPTLAEQLFVLYERGFYALHELCLELFQLCKTGLVEIFKHLTLT
jgi:hypothetical protein